MDTNIDNRGHFSILRWRNDATRDEARNIAVILLAQEGKFCNLKYAPVSSISPQLHEQGLLDAMLVGLEKRCQTEGLTLETLEEMHQSLRHSLYLTEPKSIAVPDVSAVLDSLYRAYVAPRPGRTKALTKGVVLDHVVTRLRRHGFEVRRGAYLGDFIFDAVVKSRKKPLSVIEVLSFAAEQKNWASVEHDAGHFLYALEQVDASGYAVVEPPTEANRETAVTPYERVHRWMDKARVPMIEAKDLGRLEAAMVH